jgi:lysyl-tRNA synthetase class II
MLGVESYTDWCYAGTPSRNYSVRICLTSWFDRVIIEKIAGVYEVNKGFRKQMAIAFENKPRR